VATAAFFSYIAISQLVGAFWPNMSSGWLAALVIAGMVSALTMLMARVFLSLEFRASIWMASSGFEKAFRLISPIASAGIYILVRPQLFLAALIPMVLAYMVGFQDWAAFRQDRRPPDNVADLS
jgi:hypothetical protein